MNTTAYQLKSNPQQSVQVPTEYASKAEDLVKRALKGPAGLVGGVCEHPYLTNPGILFATTRLAKTEASTPASLKLQDEVYLRVCIQGNEQKIRGPEREEAMNLDQVLIQTVENLYA